MPLRRTYYRAASDWFVMGGGILVIAFLLAGIPFSVWATNLALWERAVFAGTTALLALSVIDKLFFTVYELDAEGLSIHTQLRHVHIPYRSMREIRQAGFIALFTTKRRKRFALSRKSIVISVDDPLWKEVSVSPAEPQLFIEQLLAIIDTERSRRTTVSKKKRKKL